jgi:hypothetical protein
MGCVVSSVRLKFIVMSFCPRTGYSPVGAPSPARLEFIVARMPLLQGYGTDLEVSQAHRFCRSAVPGAIRIHRGEIAATWIVTFQ